MQRQHLEAEHEALAEAFRAFIDKEIAPNFDQWERDGTVPRELFKIAGQRGVLAMAAPAEYGGADEPDFRFNQVIGEQVSMANVMGAGLGMTLHNDICLPYFLSYCTEEQKQRWLPGIVSGELITAVGMTEPGAGSDLAGIRTSAVRSGSDYIVNGSKIFITNGLNADLVITAVRTSPERHQGLSLLVLERGMPGFERGRNLDKIGLHSQDTAELIFTDVRVPAQNLLGEENAGFLQLVHNLPQERLSIAVAAVSAARAAFETTVAYVRDRTAFGKSVGSFQNTRFVLAEISTEIDVTQSFVDHCVRLLNTGDLNAEDAAKAKWWSTDLQSKVMDRCVQLHGGYGYMTEYPISRMFLDGRVSRIYGGTNEIMKEVIGRSLGI
jgi:alkylation response protein AidB-like acyl-CoA dehydrogenase